MRAHNYWRYFLLLWQPVAHHLVKTAKNNTLTFNYY
jgi:hypothetical protein